MPSHITHILLAKDVYEWGKLKNVDKKYFLTFSLGADLSKYSKVRKLSHKVKQDELITNMCKYLKNNGLMEDEILRATIFGHVLHIIADNTIHPLIYRGTRMCKNKKLKNHTLLEGYYDAYILQKKMQLDVQNFKLKEQLQGNVSRIADMIDYAYKKTYGYKYISWYYRLMLWWYRRLDMVYSVFGIGLLIKISKYKIFKKDNFSCIDNEKFLMLYNQCIGDSLREFKNIDLNLKSASN